MFPTMNIWSKKRIISLFLHILAENVIFERVQPLVQWVNCQALDCQVAGSFIVLT